MNGLFMGNVPVLDISGAPRAFACTHGDCYGQEYVSVNGSDPIG